MRTTALARRQWGNDCRFGAQAWPALTCVFEGVSVVTENRPQRGQRQRSRSWEATASLQGGDNVGSSWIGALEVGSGQILGILQEHSIGFADGLNEECERKRGIKNDSKVLSRAAERMEMLSPILKGLLSLLLSLPRLIFITDEYQFLILWDF